MFGPCLAASGLQLFQELWVGGFGVRVIGFRVGVMWLWFGVLGCKKFKNVGRVALQKPQGHSFLECLSEGDPRFVGEMP